jgi:HK97 family phage major capsid protein
MSKAERRLEELLGEMRKANAILEGSKDDGGRRAAAIDGQHQIAKALSDNDEERERDATRRKRKDSVQAQIDELKELMASNRRPSKAKAVTALAPMQVGGNRQKSFGAVAKAHPFMKAAIRDYEAGEFLSAVMDKKGLGWDLDLDPSLVAQGKAKLAEIASFGGVPILSQSYTAGKAGEIQGVNGPEQVFAKATLGTSGATGGYVLPNNLVDSVIKPATQKAVYQQLVTVRPGVSVRGVDQPYRTSAAQRATFIDWGTTKTNVNEAYGTYSANLGTIAIIYDIGKQYARFSAGSAEQDVIDEITRGMVLGENYYIAVGAGTGGVGTGDPTAGVYTQLTAAGTPATYTTAFTSPVSSTVIGSLAEALTQGSAALAARSREVEAWVVDATTYWTAIGQTAGTFGFILTPSAGPTGFTRTQSGGLGFWGQPVYYDANLGTNATTKIAIGGVWSMLKLYRGIEFRIDTTDVAGTRWDQNLIGFRGEEEIGFHAGSAVAVGSMQLITTVIP